jgi:TetR/AcrR family fatty acid metabolism transcriptional regulator
MSSRRCFFEVASELSLAQNCSTCQIFGARSSRPRRARIVVQRSLKKDALVPVGRWGEREKGILEVATALYASEGYENVSMAAVAAAAGLSEGTLYNYFRDKQDLVLRVSAAAFEGHTVEAEAIVKESQSLRDGLQALIDLELRILIEAKEVFRIWLREVRGSGGYRQSAARKRLRDFSSQLIRLFEKWNAVPDPALGLNLPLMRDMVFGSLEHIVWTAIVQRREGELDVARLSRDLAGAYLRAFGFAAASGSKSAGKGGTGRGCVHGMPAKMGSSRLALRRMTV